MAPPTAQTTHVFAGTDQSAGRARRFVRTTLTANAVADGRIDDAEVLVSELVTNAIRHTLSGRPRGTVRVTVTVGPAVARVEVRDAGALNGNRPTLASQYDKTGQDDGGRGLQVVDEYALAWGADQHRGGGHVVWFEIARKA